MDKALMAGWGTGSEIQFIARLGRESSACTDGLGAAVPPAPTFEGSNDGNT